MNLEAEDLPEPFAITYFASDARKQDRDAFKTKHGDAFLVRKGALELGRRPPRPQRTIMIQERVLPPPPGTSAPRLPGPRPSKSLVVVPVKRTGRSPYPSMITVGRTRNNDVVLPDVVVSKFHAFFREEGGKYFLQDAESRNGTLIDGRPVPPKSAGKAIAAPSGALITFGLLEFWFLDAAGLVDLVRRSCPEE
jgi:FHA domain